MYENIIAFTNLLDETETIRDIIQCLLAESFLHSPIQVVELVKSLFFFLFLLLFFILHVNSLHILDGNFIH